MNKVNKTLRETLFAHDNNYQFDPVQILSTMPKELPSLSIVIPYYESGEIIKKTLHHLYNAIRNTREIFKNWQYEVIIVDDGSKKYRITDHIIQCNYQNLKVIFNTGNFGRTITRNKGLLKSQYNICLFMDSDILIDSQLIINHLKIQTHTFKKTNRSAITVSFFQFTDKDDPLLKLKVLTPANLKLNDYH